MWKLPSSVSQESALDTLLFCAFMTELRNIFGKHNSNFHIYTSTQTFPILNHNDPMVILQRLKSCIVHIEIWMVNHKLQLTDDKLELVVISSPQNKKRVFYECQDR